METLTLVHERLNTFIQLAHFIQDALPVDAMIGITDTEKFLMYLPAKTLNLGDIKGMPIPEGDAIYEAIKTQKQQSVSVPREAFGIPFKATAVPIRDEAGKVIGGLGVGVSLENQEKLTDLAQHFSATSEEVSVSTSELSSSALELVRSMEYLNSLQIEMKEQVDSTEKILDFISSISNNARILGLNAGIEAVRAGEFGRGFSVVANEIKKLAENSSKSVNEIRNLVVLLNEKVDSITETIQKVTSISHHQSQATEEMAEAINQLATTSVAIEELSQKI